MSRLIYCLFALACICILSGLSNGCTQANGESRHPGVQFVSDTFDLGLIYRTNQNIFKLPLTNTSDASVTINNFSSSCRCIVVDTRPVVISKHSKDSIIVKVVIDSTEYGEIYRNIAVRTTEEAQPVKIATIKFTVQ